MRTLLFGISLFVLSNMGVGFASDLASIMQVNVYEYDAVHETFTMMQRGSAVVLDAQTAITNAHVVTDESGEGRYFYELCQTTQITRPPVCFGAATIRKIRTEYDLAVLKFDTNTTLVPAQINKQTPELGSDVTVLGYPRNGGRTITQTQGKVSGFDDDYIKTDANFDAGNSGGGAFDASGKLIGVPTLAVVGYTTLGYIVPVEYIYDLLYNTAVAQQLLQMSEQQKFKQYLQTLHQITATGRVQTPQFSFGGYDRRGFEVDQYQGVEATSPHYLQLSTRDGNTGITIDTYVLNNAPVFRSLNAKRDEQTSQQFTIYKTTTKTINGQAWDITFAAGAEGFEDYKYLRFVLRDASTNLAYTIYGFESNDQPFVDAIVLFLQNFRIEEDASNKYTTTIDEFLDLLDIKEHIVADAYGYGAGGSPEHQLIISQDSLSPFLLEYQKLDVTDEFQTYTYDEFREFVVGLGESYAYDETISLQQSSLVVNQHGLTMLIQPSSYEYDSVVSTTYTVSVMLTQSGDATSNETYQYILTSTDSGDETNEKFVMFLDALQPKDGFDHPFDGLGVERTTLSTLQEVFSQ